MITDKAGEAVKEIFQSLLSKSSDIIFDSFH